MGTPSIRQAGITVVLFAISVKVIGLIREMIIAAHFGTSHVVDIYLAGITIPSLIGAVMSQTLPNAFVPLFLGKQNTGRGNTRAAITLITLLGSVAVALWFLAKPAALLTSDGFSAAAQAETIIILKIAAAAVALATIEALFRSRLLAQKRFVYTSAAGLWTSLSMVVAIALYPEGGARTLAWGFIAGSLTVAIWNVLPFVLRRGGSPPTEQSEAHPIKSSGEGSWITTVILLGSTGLLYTLLDRYLASFLDVGSIAAIQYANLVASQPVAIYGIAIGTAIFPFLSRHVAEGDDTAVGQIIDRAIRWALVGSIPVAIWIGVLGDEIVSLLYERGAFGAASRAATGRLLVAYGFWLVPAVLTPVLLRLYYSMFRWRPILVAVLTGLVVKIVLSLWLVGDLGALGLVTATAAAAISMVFILLAALPRDITRRRWNRWGRLFITLAGLSFAGAILGFYLPHIIMISEWREVVILRVAGGVVLSLGLGLLLGPRLQIDEVRRLREWVSGRRLRR